MAPAYRNSIALILVILLLFSCKQRDGGPYPPPTDRLRSIYVACEGAFGNGNSALTLHQPDVDSTYEDVYKSANGTGPGDVLQSVTRIGGELFLCVNNSDKIIRIDRQTFRVTGSMVIPKPRYMVAVSPHKAFVSTLYSNKVYIIDPAEMSVIGSVELPHKNPEDLELVHGKVYVACWDTACSTLYAIDTANYAVSNAVNLPGRAPQELQSDAMGFLWVLCGNVAKGKDATLARTNVNTGSTVTTLSFQAGIDPLRLESNPAKDSLYFLEVAYNGGTANNGVYRMPVTANALPPTAFVTAKAFQYFWGLAIDPGTGWIYVADPKGFTQRGGVQVFTPDGTPVNDFPTGVGPGHFYFD